jgi:hypothetical protein
MKKKTPAPHRVQLLVALHALEQRHALRPAARRQLDVQVEALAPRAPLRPAGSSAAPTTPSVVRLNMTES